MTKMPHHATFKEWYDAWSDLAKKIDTPIADVLALWEATIPGEGNWRRNADKRIIEGGLRYTRTHKHETPTPASEHELEMEVLRPGEDLSQTICFGEPLIDGINAVPLAKDSGGGRVANVEADMLLLSSRDGGHGVYLVEVKTGANTAWFAAVENLRQLKLFEASPTARRIFADRCTGAGELPTATAVVLAPEHYYKAPGQKLQALKRARELFGAMRAELNIDARFATWQPPNIIELPAS